MKEYMFRRIILAKTDMANGRIMLALLGISIIVIIEVLTRFTANCIMGFVF